MQFLASVFRLLLFLKFNLSSVHSQPYFSICCTSVTPPFCIPNSQQFFEFILLASRAAAGPAFSNVLPLTYAVNLKICHEWKSSLRVLLNAKVFSYVCDCGAFDFSCFFTLSVR